CRRQDRQNWCPAPRSARLHLRQERSTHRHWLQEQRGGLPQSRARARPNYKPLPLRCYEHAMADESVMVLTGCASGIGRHLTGALARRGHRILATDLNEAGLVQQARENVWDTTSVLLRKLDVRSAEDWDGALAFACSQWGNVDVVI